MNVPKALATAAAVAIGLAGPALGAATRGFSLQVVLDGSARPEYHARGAVYVEAVRDRAYVLRITTPLPVRVAVALAVDGLDTIDARHGDARSAAKWVLGPYESVEIPGWQVNGSNARRFVFTGERSSYGAWLGQTDNLGVIEAVFYRQKVACNRVVPRAQAPVPEGQAGSRGDRSAPAPQNRASEGAPAGADGVAGGVPGGETSFDALGGTAESLPKDRKLSDEYAATGIGERTRHDVEWVDLELEDTPAAVIRIRYEFREQLARLGVLPASLDPFVRREGARGFSGSYCPDPSGDR